LFAASIALREKVTAATTTAIETLLLTATIDAIPTPIATSIEIDLLTATIDAIPTLIATSIEIVLLTATIDAIPTLIATSIEIVLLTATIDAIPTLIAASIEMVLLTATIDAIPTPIATTGTVSIPVTRIVGRQAHIAILLLVIIVSPFGLNTRMILVVDDTLLMPLETFLVIATITGKICIRIAVLLDLILVEVVTIKATTRTISFPVTHPVGRQAHAAILLLLVIKNVSPINLSMEIIFLVEEITVALAILDKIFLGTEWISILIAALILIPPPYMLDLPMLIVGKMATETLNGVYYGSNQWFCSVFLLLHKSDYFFCFFSVCF
jgi:hypothetical protein